LRRIFNLTRGSATPNFFAILHHLHEFAKPVLGGLRLAVLRSTLTSSATSSGFCLDFCRDAIALIFVLSIAEAAMAYTLQSSASFLARVLRHSRFLKPL
jgi:hypothetical protein